MIDLGNYHETVHFWRYPDLGGTWVFEYYGEDRKTPEYTGTLYQDTGSVQIDIYDKNDLRVLYQYYCALHNLDVYKRQSPDRPCICEYRYERLWVSRRRSW